MMPKSPGMDMEMVARKLLAYNREEGPWYRGEAKDPELAFSLASSGSVEEKTHFHLSWIFQLFLTFKAPFDDM